MYDGSNIEADRASINIQSKDQSLLHQQTA